MSLAFILITSAHAALEVEAQRTVDSAHTRYFIAHLHRLRDE